MLFVQAAKVILTRTNKCPQFSLGEFLTRAAERMNRTKLAVSLANKLAPMARSILRHLTVFDAPRVEVAIGIKAEAAKKSSRLKERMEWNNYAHKSLTAQTVNQDFAVNETTECE